jgi:hypothetical protein
MTFSLSEVQARPIRHPAICYDIIDAPSDSTPTKSRIPTRMRAETAMSMGPMTVGYGLS